MPIRRIEAIALLAAALWCGCAGAQGRQAVRLVVPAPPGGSLDATARLVAAHLAGRLGEPVVVENRPGAATNIGTEYVVRAPPDGRTLLFGPAGLAINPSLYKLNFDPFRDLKPIIQVSVEQYILVVRNDLRAAEPHDLARLAKGKPGGLDCAAPPGVMLMACEQLRLQWAGGVTIVPYAGIAPAVNALLGGQVDLIFVPTEAVLGQVRAGRLRALANAGEHKIGSPFPDLPLLSDVWPGFTASGMYGVLAPAGTSADTVRMLNEHLNEVISSAPVRERMLGGWQVPIGGTPERYGEALRRGHDYYQKVIRAAGIGLQ